jgi:hypothetical protein
MDEKFVGFKTSNKYRSHHCKPAGDTGRGRGIPGNRQHFIDRLLGDSERELVGKGVWRRLERREIFGCGKGRRGTSKVG